MEGGMVRSILGLHLARRLPAAPHPSADPNDLVEAWTLARDLESLRGAGGDQAVRQAAADYVLLWSRTFRTLVRHLRGRPERAIALFAEEVYPYLRGDRLAARVESARPGHARILLQADLPAAYLAGLLEGFVALSGAHATATPEPGGHFSITYRLEGRDRLAKWAQRVAAQRIQLLLCALAATVAGIALAYRVAGHVEAWRAAVLLLGALSVQVGANALHDLRHAHPAGPLDLRRQDRRALLLQSRLGYAIGTACGAALAWQSPIVVAFALAGLAFSTAFGHLKNVGWGPLLAGVIYGPLLAEGALHAAAPGLLASPQAWLASAATLPLSCLAAAVLYADDLADRPLDEAGGARTLLVRLPRRRHAAGYAAIVLGGIASLAGALWALASPLPFAVAGLAVVAALLVTQVQRNLDDPRGLAPVRFGTQALHLAVAVVLVLAIVEALP